MIEILKIMKFLINCIFIGIKWNIKDVDVDKYLIIKYLLRWWYMIIILC